MSRVVALVLAVIVLSPAGADACFCAARCTPKTGAIVFEATVTAVGASIEPDLKGQNVVSLADVTVLSVDVPRALVQAASSCDYPFRIGVRYRIEGEALQTSGGRVVWASQCGATRPVWTWDLRAVPTLVDWWWSGRGCRD